MSTADTSSPTNSTRTMSTVTSAAPSAAPSGPPVSMSSSSVTGTKALAKRAIRVAQAVADARLDSAYEDASEGFDYHDSVEASKGITQTDGGQSGAQGGGKPGGAPVASYLQRMQRGGLIQAFGCLVVVEEATFNVLAFSENAKDLLGLIPKPKTEEELEVEKKAAEEEERKKAEEAAKAEAATASPSKTPSGKSGIGRAFSSLKDKISSAIRGHNVASSKHSKERGRSTATSGTSGGRVGSPARSQSPSRSWRSGFRASRRAEDWEGAHSNLSKAGDAESAPPAPPPLPPLPVLDFGVDARSLFTPDSVTALEKATGAADLSMINPVLVEAAVSNRGDHRPFYAILHRIDVGIVIDLEPIRDAENIFTGAGALQAHKLAAKAIARLQRMPPGDMINLCQAVVEEVKELTGYDRVMTYKFHEDEHGEVLAEAKKESMEPYLGLHYPATDIPQAIRFLFMKNRVRCICDAYSDEVKVVRDEGRLKQPVTLAGSQLRAAQRCHIQYMRNMGTTASMTMAVIINDEDAAQPAQPQGAAGAGGAAPAQANRGKKLWGLVVCHHETARYLPFPLRLACEFLMQVFSLQVNMELEMARQHREKEMLRTQTLLCDLLMRGDAPLGIVSQNPNIQDLVKCDGAALYYAGRFWLLGTTPTEMQILDIIDWLDTAHPDSSGLSTDSLAEAGYPRAEELGEGVCGMACARLYARDVLLWFRSHVRKEVRWGGEKHDNRDKEDEHPERMAMGPRASFAAFLEVVRQRSMPWEDVEMDAVHSLQLILRGHLTSFSDNDMRDMMLNRMRDQEMDRLSATESEMVRVLETATAPILAVDRDGCVTGWNARLAALTGLATGDALGKHLITDLVVEGNVDAVGRALFLALQGQESKELEIHLRTWGVVQSNKDSVILIVNAFASRGTAMGGDDMEDVVGVCFVGQDVTAQKAVQGKFTRLQGDYEAIVHGNNSLIPPIFSTDGETHSHVLGGAWGDYEAIVPGSNSLIPPIFSTDCQCLGAGLPPSLHPFQTFPPPSTPFHFFHPFNPFRPLSSSFNPFHPFHLFRSPSIPFHPFHLFQPPSTPFHLITDFGNCTDWNPAMERITGVPRQQAIDRLLLGGIFGPICRMKADTMTKLMIVINKAMSGQMTDRYPLEFLDAHGQLVEALLTVQTCRDSDGHVTGMFCVLHTGQLVEALLTVQTRRDSDGHVTGVFCFLHTVSAELQAALNLQRATQDFAKEKAKAVAYTRDAIRGPLDGIEHALEGLRKEEQEGRLVGEEEKNAVGVAERCKEQVDRILGDDDIDTIEEGAGDECGGRGKEQVDRILGDDDIDTIEEGYVIIIPTVFSIASVIDALRQHHPSRLHHRISRRRSDRPGKTSPLYGLTFPNPSLPTPLSYVNIIPAVFTIASVIDAVIAQGKQAASRREVSLSFDPPPQLRSFPGLAGDPARLQQALAEYLTSAVAFTPQGGWVKVRLVTSTRSLFGDQGSLKCEFRVQHSGALPQELVQQLYDEADPTTRTQEGLGLSVCRKILLAMAGDVQYDRNYNACEFVILLAMAGDVQYDRNYNACEFVVRIGFPFT
ncbi:unnamed protein product [Closterium sp. NIES-64]|nr:unnamed protein product [Closterium sp. NIES-64]